MNFKKLSPFYYCMLQSFPFIEATFAEIDNYRLLCRIVEYLNQTREQVNQSGKQVETLTKAFNDLKDYIDNYFVDNNLQEEVNRKLDELVENGTLAEIINNEVFENMNNNIKNILEINQADILPSLYGEYLLPDRFTNYTSMQSGCITDNYIVFGVIPTDENNINTLLVVIDKNTMQVVNEITPYIFHHCESMCYANGVLYIKDGVRKQIFAIEESELIKDNISFLRVIDYTAGIGAICYNTDNNTFYGANNNQLFKLDNNFNIVETYQINTDETDNSVVQGISYIDNKFILAKIVMPTTAFTSIVNSKTIITDLKGKILLNYDCTDNLQGELEWAQYFGNGLVLECKYSIAGSGRNPDVRFYLTNYFKNFSDNIYTNISRKYFGRFKIVTDQTIQLNCDKTATNILVDGTETKPFHDLKHLIEYASSLQVNNQIRIILNGDYSDETHVLRNFKNTLSIVAKEDSNPPHIGTVTIENMTLYLTYVNAKRLNCAFSKINLQRCRVVNAGSTAIFLNNTTLLFEDSNEITGSYNGINSVYNSVIESFPKTIAESVYGNNNDVVLSKGSKLLTEDTAIIKITTDKYSRVESGVIFTASNSNLNNLKVQGLYSTQQNGYSSITNKPSGVAENFTIENKYSGNYMIQTLTTVSGKTYTRVLNTSNNSWSAWN